MAANLCGKDLISRETHDQVLLTTGMAPVSKAGVLLAGVEGRIAIDRNSKEPFMNLCSVLEKHQDMKRVGRKLKKGKDIVVNSKRLLMAKAIHKSSIQAVSFCY